MISLFCYVFLFICFMLFVIVGARELHKFYIILPFYRLEIEQIWYCTNRGQMNQDELVIHSFCFLTEAHLKQMTIKVDTHMKIMCSYFLF